MSADQERMLVRKLVEQLHLSVPERRTLPGGFARLSLVVDAIGAIVRESGSFPANAQPDGTDAVEGQPASAVGTFNSVQCQA